jgi:hypothetical protein
MSKLKKHGDNHNIERARPSANEKLGWSQLNLEKGPEGNTIHSFHPAQMTIMNKMLEEKTRAFLALWRVGSGKTLLAVLSTQALLQQSFVQHNKRRKAVLVVGKSLLSRFRAELNAYGRTQRHIHKYYSFWTYQKAMLHWKAFGRECRDNIVVIDEIHFLRSPIKTTTAEKEKEKEPPPPPQAAQISVSSSSSALKEEEKKAAAPRKKTNKKKLTLKGYTVTQGQRAAAILRGARRGWKILGMTATPMVNFVSDIVNLGYIMTSKPKEYLEAFMKSSKQYQKLDQPWNSLTAEDVLRLDKAFRGRIHCWLTTSGDEEKKSQVKDSEGKKLTMPTSQEINVLIEMDVETHLAYQEVEQAEREHLLKRGETKLQSMGMFYNGVRRAVNKIGLVPSQKIKFILSLVLQHRKRQEKGIIASAWLEYGTALVCQELQKHGVRVALLTGELTEEARTVSVEQFNSSLVDVIVLSGAGSTGIDLHGAAFHVNIEGHWNETSRKQANGRGVRLGSHRHSTFNHVTIYNLILCKPKHDFVRAYILMQTVISLRWPGAPQKIILQSCSSSTHGSENKDNDEKRNYQKAIQDAHTLLSMADPTWKSPLGITAEKKKASKKESMQDCSIDVYLWLLQLKKSRAIEDFTRSILCERWDLLSHK